MIIAGTGHRPEDSEPESYVRTKARVKLQYPNKSGLVIETFITGMAAGFDLWAGDEALNLGLDVWAAVPWKGHKPRKGDEALYERILAGASKIVWLNDSETYPGAFVYPNRNHWMVDNCDAVMAYWSGKEKGGTYECITYAREAKKPIANIYLDPPF